VITDFILSDCFSLNLKSEVKKMACDITSSTRKRIKDKRKGQFTQQEMADKLFMSKNNYQTLENSDRDISIRQLDAIAKVLGTSIGTLVAHPDYSREGIQNCENIIDIIRQAVPLIDELDARVKSYK